MAKPLIVIVGPTASGKTALSIDIAKKHNGEIICADSRTVYKGLNIATAKPTIKEQQGIRHHLLDVAGPDERFTAADFKKLATIAIDDIHERGKLPIMVGGSGLYVDSVLFDYGFSGKNTPKSKLNPRHLAKDQPKIHSKIREDTLIIGISVERDILKERITERVDQMIADGLLEEVSWLMDNYPNSKALDSPGYKAFKKNVDGSVSLVEAKSEFIKNDFNLAKRQMTWFRRNKNIIWSNIEDSHKLVAKFLLKYKDE